MPRSMVLIAPINGFQKEQTCLKPFQGKRLRKYISLKSIMDLGHGKLLQKRLKRLEPNQGQRHRSHTNLRSTLVQRFQILMKEDPIKVGYLDLSDLCRSVSKHPTTASGTSIADARDT